MYTHYCGLAWTSFVALLLVMTASGLCFIGFQETNTVLLPVLKDGKWGYINKQGEMVIEPKYDGAFFFQDRIAQVKLNGKWGYINQAGKLVIKPRHSTPWFFYDGAFRVSRSQETWVYFDMNENLLFSIHADFARDFSEGLAAINRKGKWG